MSRKWCGAAALVLASSICFGVEGERLVAPGAEVAKLVDGFRFTEGPAADAAGDLFFTDIPNNRIHKWSLDGKLSTFREDSGGANGLFFDRRGNLVACEGGRGRLVSITPDGKLTVLAENYEGKRFNSPNDLWVDQKGGVYFTDPRYGRRDDMAQDGEHVYYLSGEHVYYLSGDHKRVLRVISDMVRPNGVTGTADGKVLYVADAGAGKTYKYKIQPDGTLADRELFASQGSDGMTIDSEGNIYLCTNVVTVYNPQGQKVEEIEVPERPSNVCFGGKDSHTLFITARTSLYSIGMRVTGAKGAQTMEQQRFQKDIIKTGQGDLEITFIGHGTLAFAFSGKVIHVDPWSNLADYSTMPKADIILVTHGHSDHLDVGAIETLRKPGTAVVVSSACEGKVKGATVMSNGDTRTIGASKIEAVPAYNIEHKRPDGSPFHPRGEGNGYVITFGDKKVYVAGDTENTPEMKALQGIDIAFLPMNLPYTMTPEMVADAARAFRPRVLYPYHYGKTDTGELVKLLSDEPGIEVRIRNMK